MDLFSIYSKLPVFAQNFLCSIQGYRLKKQRFNKTFEQILRFLNTTQNWSDAQIKDYKEEHIKKIITHAFNTCPYYRRKYSGAGVSPEDFKCLEDLKKFPILTKDEIRENWKGMISTEYSKKDLIFYHTSGSTGTPLNFYWTKYSVPYYWALDYRYKNRFCDTNELSLVLTGKPVVPASVKRPPYWRFIKPFNEYRINMQHISKDKISVIANFINDKNFIFITGYCSIVASLATLLDESNLLISNPPQHLFTGSEKLFEYQKNIIKKVFKGIQIHEMYSFSEQAAFASHCIDNKYHEDFEIGHLELDQIISSSEGKYGDILATGFMNWGMPFIRYKVGDTAVFSDSICDCGSKSQVIKEIVGRIEDKIITPEGSNITRLDYIFKGIDGGIQEAQVVQKKLGEMIIRIVKKKNCSSNIEINLMKNIRTFVSPSILVKFEYVDNIPRTKADKFKAVLSELDCIN